MSSELQTHLFHRKFVLDATKQFLTSEQLPDLKKKKENIKKENKERKLMHPTTVTSLFL
jgi:hypothetical protein